MRKPRPRKGRDENLAPVGVAPVARFSPQYPTPHGRAPPRRAGVCPGPAQGPGPVAGAGADAGQGRAPSFQLCSWSPHGLLNPRDGFSLLCSLRGPGQRGWNSGGSKYLVWVALDFVIDHPGNRRKPRVTGRFAGSEGSVAKSRPWHSARDGHGAPSTSHGVCDHTRPVWQRIGSHSPSSSRARGFVCLPGFGPRPARPALHCGPGPPALRNRCRFHRKRSAPR